MTRCRVRCETLQGRCLSCGAFEPSICRESHLAFGSLDEGALGGAAAAAHDEAVAGARVPSDLDVRRGAVPGGAPHLHRPLDDLQLRLGQEGVVRRALRE